MLLIPAELRSTIDGQFGLATTKQLTRWLSPATVVRLKSAGVLLPHRYGVHRLAGAPVSWRQGAMGACLAYGPPVAICRLAAARLWGWDGVGLPPVMVTVPRGRSARRCGIATVVGFLPPEDIAWCHHIPVTTPARTLVDLAGRFSDHQLELLLDRLLALQLASPDQILARVQRRTPRTGVDLAALRKLVELRLDSHPPGGDSVWEDRVAGWLIRAGLPAPVRQHVVTAGDQVFLLDLAYPDHLVAVEFDGWQHHRSRRSFDRDRARATELALRGWLVVQVTSAHGEANHRSPRPAGPDPARLVPGGRLSAGAG